LITEGEGKDLLFVNKKKQKNFINLPSGRQSRHVLMFRSFLLLFFKKEDLPSLN